MFLFIAFCLIIIVHKCTNTKICSVGKFLYRLVNLPKFYLKNKKKLKTKNNQIQTNHNTIDTDAIISLDSPSPPTSPSVLSGRHSDFTGNGYTNISTASANLNAALLANSFDAQAYLNFPDFSSGATQSSIDRLPCFIITLMTIPPF